MNSSSSSSGNDIFYHIFRNSFLRNVIRNVLLDVVLEISLDENDLTNRNKLEYLSTISKQEKLKNNITIRFVIDSLNVFNQYLNSRFKHVINDIQVQDEFSNFDRVIPTAQQEQEWVPWISFNHFHNDLVRLSFCIDERSIPNDNGEEIRLPDSLTELDFSKSSLGGDIVNRLFSNLPQSIKKLSIPASYTIVADKLVLPKSLVELRYPTNNNENLKKLVIQPRSSSTTSSVAFTFNSVKVETTNDLEWVSNQTWITKWRYSFDELRVNTIPSHVTDVTIPRHSIIEQGSLPSTLKSVTMGHDVDNILPASLERLVLFNSISLEPNFLPTNLTVLELTTFNTLLTVGFLPSTLTSITLNSYNHPLDPFVLPQSLKEIKMNSFQHQLMSDSLPKSITDLRLYNYTGSFEHISPLTKLKELWVRGLTNSTGNLISNAVKDLKIIFITHDNDIGLSNKTSITKLSLYYMNTHAYKNMYPLASLPSGLPTSLKHLFIRGIEPISPIGTIPDSCVCLDHSSRDLDVDLLPSSIKHIRKPQKYRP